MSMRVFISLILVLVLPFVYSCSDDSDDTIVTPAPDAYRALTLRDNVLFNLEKAWVDRSIARYDELLDDAFVFHFSEADVKNGDVMVSQWGRAAEMAAAGNIFDPNFVKPGQAPVSSVALILVYTEGETQWGEVLPDQQQYPGETWYSKSFRYRLTLQAGDFTYVGNNLQATILVRMSDGDSGVWRIVSWSDDTDNQLREMKRAPALVEGTSWGKMKNLYSD